MDLIITMLPGVTKDLPISPRFTPYDFLSRCMFSTLTTLQPMIELERIMSRFGSLSVWVVGYRHDATRWPSYVFVTTSRIDI